MPSIADVTLELVLDIIEYLKPYSFPLGSNENLRYGASILESWHNFKQQASYSEAPASESQITGENTGILQPKEAILLLSESESGHRRRLS